MEQSSQPPEQPSQQQPPAPGVPAVRASNQERDAAVQRLQAAFAEGRLDDEEFDQRTATALRARTRAELDQLLADLPAAVRSGTLAPASQAPRLMLGFKGSIARRGRWRVPERSMTVAYKGSCELDLRAAELTEPVTTINALAYKGRVEVIVPRGVRVEAHGSSYGGTVVDHRDEEPIADVPLVRVRGFAYKGSVEVRASASRSRELPAG
ncbi:MAG TPA: DUF1707 domain-containing protein [Actinomycetota bacterium]